MKKYVAPEMEIDLFDENSGLISAESCPEFTGFCTGQDGISYCFTDGVSSCDDCVGDAGVCPKNAGGGVGCSFKG